jgi:hypothetical protein
LTTFDADAKPVFWEVTVAPPVEISRQWLRDLCERVNAEEIILYQTTVGEPMLYLRMPNGIEMKAPVMYWHLVGAKVYCAGDHSVLSGPH